MFDAKILQIASSVGLATLLAGSPFASAQVTDPLKPEGVALGMSVSDVDSALAAAGYEKLRNCQYRKRDERSHASVLARPSRCDAEGSVQTIIFERLGRGAIDGTPIDVVGRMRERIGSEGDCRVLMESSASCRWHSPAGAPHVGSLPWCAPTSPA